MDRLNTENLPEDSERSDIALTPEASNTLNNALEGRESLIKMLLECGDQPEMVAAQIQRDLGGQLGNGAMSSAVLALVERKVQEVKSKLPHCNGHKCEESQGEESEGPGVLASIFNCLMEPTPSALPASVMQAAHKAKSAAWRQYPGNFFDPNKGQDA